MLPKEGLKEARFGNEFSLASLGEVGEVEEEGEVGVVEEDRGGFEGDGVERLTEELEDDFEKLSADLEEDVEEVEGEGDEEGELRATERLIAEREEGTGLCFVVETLEEMEEDLTTCGLGGREGGSAVEGVGGLEEDTACATLRVEVFVF